MAIKKLSSENAIIKTAGVEIKSLTISGKQVTLAVFRQLPEKALINLDSLALNGLPWGWVNYHPDKCADDEDHIHVVWQEKTTLYRSRVLKRVLSAPVLERLCVATQFFSAWEYREDVWMSRESEWCSRFNAAMYVTEQIKTIEVERGCDVWGLVLSVSVSKKDELMRLLEGRTRQELGDELCRALKARDVWQERYAALYGQLVELDQLYIAV